jgi:hypothetical protein
MDFTDLLETTFGKISRTLTVLSKTDDLLQVVKGSDIDPDKEVSDDKKESTEDK